MRIPSLGISFFDGTAPHNAEPTLAGAREEIVNLGQFWDAKQLRQNRAAIEWQSECKKRAYNAALDHLRLAGQLKKHTFSILQPYVDQEKLNVCAKRFAQKRRKGSGEEKIEVVHSYGMKGERMLPTFRKKAERIVGIRPCYGVEYLYGKAILDACRDMGVAVCYSPHPLLPSFPELLFFEEEKLLVTINTEEKAMGTRRFWKVCPTEQRKLLCFLKQGEKNLIEAAMDAFEKMKTAHFALESIYGKAMDFERKQQFSDAFLRSIFDR